MKKVFTYLAIASLALVACQKEAAIEKDNAAANIINNIPTEIVCEISETATKTQYAGNTTFGWTENDVVRMTVKNGSNQWNYFSFKTTDASGNPSATFIRNNSGTPGDNMETYDPSSLSWTNCGYLLYPTSIFDFTGTQNNGVWNSGDYPVVNLPSAIAYNSTNPLDGGVLPLIGRKVGSTYKFATAVGVLKAQITGLDSKTTKVSLSSLANSLSGKFAVSDESASVAQIAKSSVVDGTKAVSLTMTTPTADESLYYPVPIGDYDASDLSLKIEEQSGETIKVRTKRIKKAISISRNEVLSIPTLAMSYPNSVSIDWSMTSSPELSFTNASGYSLRICVLNSSTHDLSEYNENMKWTIATTGGKYALINTKDKAGTGKAIGAPGKYFLHYMILNTSAALDAMGLSSLDDARIVEYGTIPFYYISKEVSSITGEYYINNNSNFVVTFTESDNIEKGNVMISHYKGGEYDADMKMYGTYNALYGTLSFNAANKTEASYSYALVKGGDPGADISLTFYSHEIFEVRGQLRLYSKDGENWIYNTSQSFGWYSGNPQTPYLIKHN